MKYLKNALDFRFIFGAILIIAFMAVTNYESNLKHDHVVEKYSYANGMKTYEVTYCKTERVQILFGKEHRKTLASDKYFNTEK